MKTFNLIFSLLFLFISISSADVTGTKIQGPALIEGFNEVTSAAGTTTLTKDSQTKQILTGTTTQTFVLPDATTLPLSRRFLIINKSTGTATIQTSGGGALAIVSSGKQKEFHLRSAGSAAGTWDELDTSGGGGGGTWGSITGTLSDQTDLQTALNAKAPTASPTFTGTIGTPLTASRLLATDGSGNLSASTVTTTTAGYLDPTSSVQTQLNAKAPLASPTFTGTIGTPLTASKLLATDASGNLTATAANSSQASYLDFASSGQTQLNGKLGLSNFISKGDIVAGVSSGVVSSLTLGGEGSYLLSDPNNITNGVRWGTPAGLTNYVKQSQAEGGITTGWATYADAAGTSPVDGTGGSPNSTFSTTSTNPLRGSNSFTFTLNTGATRQGEGVCYTITIDRADSLVPKQQKIEFDYEITSGTFVAGNDTDRTSAGDSTLTVWVVDTTSGQVIQPSTYRLYSNTSDHYSGYFQNNYNSASYRVCLHKGTSATVSGSNIVVKLDEFKVAPSTYLAGTPISDWLSWTPTGGLTGAVSYSGKWRRVGDTGEYAVTVTTSGAPTGSGLSINLPSGHVIDTSKLNTTTADVIHVGTSKVLDSGALEYGIGYVKYTSTTSVTALSSNASTTYLASAGITPTVPITFGASDSVDIRFSVPITGWASSTQISDDYGAREVSASFSTNAGSIATSATTWTTVTFSTPDFDTVSSWNGSDTYTVKSAGTYELGISAGQNSAAANYFRTGYRINSGTDVVLGQAIGKTGGAAYFFASRKVKLNAGDTIQFRAFTEGTEGISPTRTAFIKKEQSPQTMSATEIVSAKYTGATGSAPPTSATVKDFGTKVWDTHGAVTTGASWKFSAPYPGRYSIKASDAISSSTIQSYNIQAFVNTTASDRGYVARPATVAYNLQAQVNTEVDLLAGDYIQIKVNADTATATTGANDATLQYVIITKIK